MASRLYDQFLYSFSKDVVFIEGSFRIGGTGAVAPSSGVLGRGIQGVTKTSASTGVYQIQLNDNYNRFLDFQAVACSPTSGGAVVTDGSLLLGKPYQIVFPSTSTNWQTLGLPSGLTATQGMPFVATSGASNGPSGSSGATAAGNGTVIAFTTSGVSSIELLPNPNTELFPNIAASSSLPGGQGAYLFIQCLNTSGAPVNPTSGSVIRFNLMLRNSSLVLNNELPTNY